MHTDRALRAMDEESIAGFMREALAEAEAAGLAGELPIGAVVVVDGQVISRGRARHQARRSQLMHAEMEALLHGGARLWERPDDAVLFTSLEPCPMCLGAAVMADVANIVFSVPDGCVQSRALLNHSGYVRSHICSYRGGVLEEEGWALLARLNPQLHRWLRARKG